MTTDSPRNDATTGSTATPPQGDEVETTLRSGFPRLSFTPRLEHAFRDYFFDKSLKRLRIALLTGIIFYALFAIDDLLLLPDLIGKLWLIRFAIVVPFGLLIFLFTFSPLFRRFMQPAVWLAMQVGGLGIIAMIALDPERVGSYHNAGLLLDIMYSFTLVGLRFWYSLSWAATLLTAYLLVSIPSPVPAAVVVHNFFTLFAAANIGAISNYLLERYMRKDFLQTLLLEEEKRELQVAGEKLHALSIIDDLTGIANRRHFELFINQEWQRALRNQTPISLILYDIDFFKPYNDGYGHQAGDTCLRRVAQLIQASIHRPGDLAARYGGEEFVVVLSGVEMYAALALAEKCRQAIEKSAIPHRFAPTGRVVTVSAGVATVTPHGSQDRQELIESADQALYAAKHGGRNQVRSGKPSPISRHGVEELSTDTTSV
ncbi:MAG TPA: diguanylate cyclase, partial [Geobacterales bacterium]|nr:diguanylate cyclase [Geobacterales bacterium]